MSTASDDPKVPDDGSVPAPVEAEVAAATAAPHRDPGASGSVDVAVSSPKLYPATSGSIDVVLLPRLPKVPEDGVPTEVASASDSAPVSSGRVTSMTVAATGPTEAARSKRITDVGKDMIGKGVETVGGGLEAIGGGVSRLGEVSRKVPVVGSTVAKLGEGITSVGESITGLPRAARTRKGALLVRSLIVGFLLVSSWIAVIVLLQIRGTDSPDFRPPVEHILQQLGQGKAAIEELYEKSSPRFQEVVRKERFVDDMLDLYKTCGRFIEVTAINESLVTSGPTGRIGRMSLFVQYAKGLTRAAVSLHWYEGEWKLLGVSVEVPPELKITQEAREERVATCSDPMDSKRCDVHVTANHILEQLRDGGADTVWDEASDVFQKQEPKGRFIQIEAEHQRVLGEYRRIITVTEARNVIGGTRATFDVLAEFAHTNVRAIFGFVRTSKAEPWKLRSLKVALPMPRSDDITAKGAGSGSATPVEPTRGSGSAGSGS